ncbi:unnamed protein product, partial [Brenthis ino]
MWFLLVCVFTAFLTAESAGAGAARLVCYVENAGDFAECTHLVYAGDARGEKLDSLLKEYRKNNPRLKILVRASEADKSLQDLLKSKHVQGLEIYDAHLSFNKSKVVETVENARSAINANGGGPLFLALPAHPELLAKYYDLRTLLKKVDLMMVQTHALGMVKKMTYHPSRLSGLWDMMNTDSVVDLVIGLGVPASKIVISLPATARQFTLTNETLSTPGSPTEDDEPKEIDQAELCRQIRKGRWTLERDQDLSAPYAFKDLTWISFEDPSSVDVKGKYARVRGLAGLALHKADKDTDTPCGPTLRTALSKVLNQQSRAPRAAVLRSLENEILSAPFQVQALDALQVSPYRITQVVDSDGVIHSIREDTRTEFSCTRQGYFVHPRSCARFYRCVKFDQLSPEFTVFEFDCPAGLAFDARYEVCVWPGSLPNSQACPGSSEIAPVPHARFTCPAKEGYYADPENCRWFFACLDHGKSMEAYEFRCPFGLGFDAARLKCDWPWLVPNCGNIGRYEAEAFGFSGAVLTGATGFQGKSADSVNIAAHQSLVSGASLDNLVGIQNGFLSKDDVLDTNFIASQEVPNVDFAGPETYQIDEGSFDYALGGQGEPSGLSYKYVSADNINKGLVQATNYNDEDKYTSGSIILDDYRLPANKAVASGKYIPGLYSAKSSSRFDSGKYKGNSAYPGASPKYDSGKYNSGFYRKDKAGQYVHNPAGDRAKPYKHIDVPPVPYDHNDPKYKQNTEYDVGGYKGSYDVGGYKGSYDVGGYKGSYDVGGYQGSYDVGGYKGSDDVGSYSQDSLKGYDYPKPAIPFNEGPTVPQNLYSIEGQLDGYTNGASATTGGATVTYHGHTNTDSGKYVADNTGFNSNSHSLTAGAVKVDLVGKTSLVDVDYSDKENYASQSYSSGVVHSQTVAQPAVSITHIGTDSQNLDGYSYVTTPTSSGIPTTATPLPVTYRTTYVPEVPKSSIKQVFGYTQPAVTYVQPTVVPVKVTDNNQGLNYQFESKDYSLYNTASNINSESGYDYSKPATKLESTISYSTPAPSATVVSYQPQGFGHSQQTIHKVESVGFEYSTPTPVNEQPFKKLVAYTTGPSVSTYVEPAAQSYSHQTIHKVESANAYTPSVEVSGQVSYEVPQTFVQYSTPKPVVSVQPVISTYEPKSVSQQTVHSTVDLSKSNVDSQRQSEEGYEYKQPLVHFQEAPKLIQYSTPAPTEYKSQAYSSQSINRYNTKQYVPVSSTARPIVSSTPVTVYENPILKYTAKATPVTYVSSTYAPQSYSQQTIHRDDSRSEIVSDNQYVAGIRYQEPQTTYYTTGQPALAVQPTISTYQPQAYSQQTIHKIEADKVNAYDTSVSGYEYSQPAVSYETTNVVSSTSVPVVASTYRPKSYSQQTIHKVERQRISSTPLPKVELTYQEPSVSIYENPILKYTQSAAPITYVQPTTSVFTQTYKPVQSTTNYVSKPVEYESSAQQAYETGYSYSQPEIQRNVENVNTAKYSDATLVSQQYFTQSHNTGNTQFGSGKDVVFVSSTPSTLVYEDHYAEYESARKVKPYKAPEYIPPKNEYQQTFVSSTASTPVVQQSSVTHTQDQYDYKSTDYSQQYEGQSSSQFTNSQSNSDQSQIVESVHFSSVPEYNTQYTQAGYQSPEIQVAYKAEEYLPPVASTAVPVVTSTYRPRFSTTTSREYLPPTSKPKYTAPEYLPPVRNTYTVQSTAAPVTKSLEYLPPSESASSSVVNFESFGYNEGELLKGDSKLSTYQDFSVPAVTPIVVSSTVAPATRKSNIVIETAKSHLLGFGTVGPDAGLISTYTTPTTIVSSTDNYYLAPVSSTYAAEVTSAPRRTKTKYLRPAVKSTTQSYEESKTAYKAPEYLPPAEEFVQENRQSFDYQSTGASKIQYNPFQEQVIDNTPVVVATGSAPTRKQNIIVQTAKSHLLGFGTVGTDAGLVSEVSGYSTPGPVEISHGGSAYSTVPVRQELVEVGQVVRKTKPKVAVVTKLNDFNPLLVRKLGAVCSCQSPVLVLKGRRPSVQEQDVEDYTGHVDAGRGDIDDGYVRKSSRFSTIPINTVTATPIVSSTFNPIIVPEDSYYQDYPEASNDNIAIVPTQKEYSEGYVSSTPVVSTTERIIKIKPRVKAITVAPTYKSVLLDEEQSSLGTESESPVSEIDSQSFNRYGPGGWRGRDETLQGSIDCKRAGLFRHPKQCNKFYACRWDCTKQRFTLHIFNCPVQLSFDPNLGACNWPSQGPACQGDTLLTNAL